MKFLIATRSFCCVLKPPYCLVLVTMVIHDFKDARMQTFKPLVVYYCTFTTDGYANQTVISVCLLLLHFQHIDIGSPLLHSLSKQMPGTLSCHPTPPLWHLLPCLPLLLHLSSAHCGSVVSLRHNHSGNGATALWLIFSDEITAVLTTSKHIAHPGVNLHLLNCSAANRHVQV